MRKFFYILIAFLALLCTGCDNSGTSTTLSSVAKLSAFSFAAVDSMPGLGKAVFTVEERLDTGLVWNQDSILFGTSLKRVVPRFTFAATPSASSLIMPDTTCRLTGYDTLDFSKGPIYLYIRSADKSTSKVYEIRPTVHQIDPDLYSWTLLNSGIYAPDDSEQRVVEVEDQFVMITSNGFALHAYSSEDGIFWDDLGMPIGLPDGTRVRQIISDGSTLYYGQGNAIYTSTDAIHWTEHSVSENVVTMLIYWNNEVWALTVKDEQYELAIYFEGELILTGLKPDHAFPVSDFAAVTFTSASGRDRAMIVGGFAENGQSLNTRWNLEYADYYSDGAYRLEEFSINRPQFTSLTGISIIWYNKQLLLFGGVDDKMTYIGRDILISNNEGLTWTPADTTKNRLPDVYQARQKQNAIVRDNYIYLFGGQTSQTTYSDVFCGRLNSIDW